MRRKIFVVGGGIALLIAVIALFLVARNALVVRQTDQEWQAVRAGRLQNLGTTRSLEILPLFEEAAVSGDLESEHGVSYLVRTDHQNILLDVGMTPARLSHNMRALGVSEKDFDIVFITHLHPDHAGGPDAWRTNTLVAGDPGLDLRGKRVFLPMATSVTGVEPTVVTQPMKIVEGVATLGSIAFPDWFMNPVIWQPNAEQALAVNVEGTGIVLITGCGHPTVERLVARAQAMFDEPIVGIVGGLHYQDMTRDQVQTHLAFIVNLKPQLVAVSPHDSTTEDLQAFRDALPDVYQEIQVGRTISFGQPLASK